MSRKYFGTDGVRGKVGEFPITPSFAMKLGWAAGTVLASTGTKEVLIGKDTRISGYMLESAMEAGFSAAGVNVALVGPMPTPAVAYLASTFRADAGVVISASHNPFYDNGIKFFGNSGIKLNDAQEQEIEELLEQAIKFNAMGCVESDKLGKARRIDDAAGRYIEFCKGTFPKHLSLSNLKVVVDCANGAAYHIAPNVFSELGANVININDKPDGLNINEKCGATHLESLQKSVIENEADLGIAVDGDADRVMFVDHLGEVVDGDEILFILAQAAKKNNELDGGVVGTLMSNLGLELALKGMDIPFIRAKVGDRYVVAQLKETGWQLGGEGSGHILSLRHTSTGDGIVAALQVIKAVQESGVSLSELKKGMSKLPQVLINVKLKADNADEIMASDVVAQAVRDAEGVLAENGRVLLRKSGTEPLIRVMVESTDITMTQSQAEFIAKAVKQAS
ncbi:phosphoglucosamine mutase [Parashewanella spongiae]|uniref:Phosphoglucosamine mutase n=1 Tax=Parashewanella spongiae TaxID=342950 RepID=A0A3A6U257_9GAMM|nr:phosphoglucosamine mutase [Parashewanella spongiae]MCL1077701.1 phosphoglucosamine mutase [Parashewanella spongiae]RJY18103.1 phosphoglucosamine mutase [Parashewanella spongiae]